MVNGFLKWLLRSPFHFLAGGGIDVDYVYRTQKWCKVYTTPVQFKRDGDKIIFITQKGRVWYKNLQDSAPVTLHIKGTVIESYATLITDDVDETKTGVRMMFPKFSDEKVESLAEDTILVQLHAPQANA